MGIKNFTKFLKDKYPQVFTNIHISQFSKQKIGIDSQLFMYKFKCSTITNNNSNEIDWKTQLCNFLISLRKNGVHPIMILEGKNKPIAKNNTVKARIESRELVKKRIIYLNDLKTELQFNDSSKGSDNGSNNGRSEKINNIIKELQKVGQKMDIFPKLNCSNNGNILKKELLLEIHPAIKVIEEENNKLLKRTICVLEEDINLLKEICDGLGITYIQSEGEAEAFMCRLLQNKLIDGVMTDDTDVIAYGCNMWISKYIIKTGECKLTSNETICNALEITKEQLLDLCVLSGNDYCENPRGLGNIKLLNLIKKNDTYKTELWNEEYECAKQIFLNQGNSQINDELKINWCIIPPLDSINKIIKNINYNNGNGSAEQIRNKLKSKIQIH